MEGKSRAGGGLSFSYPRAALAGAVLMTLVIAALSWVNGRRAETELSELKAKLCASSELGSGLSVNDAASPSSWQAWAIVDAVAGIPGEEALEVRVLQQINNGWRQWHRGSPEPEWVHDAELDEISRNGNCEGAVRKGTIRIVRPLRTGTGIPTLIVVERKRR